MARRKHFISICSIALLIWAGQTHATLIGDTVNITSGGFFFSNEAPPSAVIGLGGPEFTVDYGSDRQILVDVGASSIDFQWNNVLGAGFGDNNMFITLFDLDWVGNPGIITGLIVTETDGGGVLFGGNFATHTQDSVTLNIRNIWDTTDLVHVELITSHVPEPTTLALMGLGLAGLGFTRRKIKA